MWKIKLYVWGKGGWGWGGSQFKREGWKVLVRDLGRTDEAGAPPFTLFLHPIPVAVDEGIKERKKKV